MMSNTLCGIASHLFVEVTQLCPWRNSWVVSLLLLAGCGGAQATNLARARIDTLPGGRVEVSNEGPTSWTDSLDVLVEEGRFQGEDGTPAELGEPRSIAVDEAGRIYIVDSKPAAIKVFTPDGKLIRSIGREGEGPGEFRVGFIAVRGGHLVLHDPQVARTSVFDTAGNYLRGWHSSCCYWTDIQLDKQNRISVPSTGRAKPGEQRGTSYVRWSLEGTVLDTLWVPRRDPGKTWTVELKRGGKSVMAMSTGVPFMPQTTLALHPEGGFVYGWTGQYRVVRSATGQDSLRIFGRSWTPDAISDERRKAEVESKIKQTAEAFGEENARSAFKLEDVPGTLPAYLNLRVDEASRVWVRRYGVADTLRTSYDVFDSTGAFLGPVTIPLKLNEWGLQAWTRDALVAIIEDAEGRPTVVRLRLRRP